MQHWEGGLYQVLTNDDSGLTLTYFTMATMPINGKTLKIFPLQLCVVPEKMLNNLLIVKYY